MTNTITTQDASRPNASSAQNQSAPNTCCGGAAPAGTDACCARDAEVKATGGSGCGCGAGPGDRTVTDRLDLDGRHLVFGGSNPLVTVRTRELVEKNVR